MGSIFQFSTCARAGETNDVMNAETNRNVEKIMRLWINESSWQRNRHLCILHSVQSKAGVPGRGETLVLHSYSAGEKSVSAMKVESTLSTSFPFSSDASRTFCHSGSSTNAFQLLVAASRLGWARM